jgi:hypothetical protein
MPMNTSTHGITLLLEHSPDEGMLPLICPDTGRRLGEVIADMQILLERYGIALTFTETIAAPPPPGHFHRLLINDRPLEEFVAPRKRISPCAGCPLSCDESVECGECANDAFWDDFPESVVRLAVLKAAGLKK